MKENLLDVLLEELEIQEEEFERMHSEYEQMALQTEGPKEALEEWAGDRTKAEKRAFVHGMVFMFFVDKLMET